MTAFGYGATQPSSAVASPYILAQWGVPAGVAPNADWNNGSGSFTLGTALNETYSRGLWLRFAGVGVNSSTGGPAASGLYWCVMNSTTEGQAYALPSLTTSTAPLVITGTSAFTPYIPLASQLNGLLPTTAGTHVQTTATNIVVANVTVSAGTIGINGALRTWANVSNNNSAGAKTVRAVLGATSVITSVGNTTGLGGSIATITHNRGVANAQISGVNYNVANYSMGLTTIDTTSDFVFQYVLNIATATDYIILQSAIIEILPST